MRRAGLLALVALLVPTPASEAATGDRCAASASKTVRQTSAARVYWRNEILYGCLRESGIRRRLYDARVKVGNDDTGPHLVRTAGTHVAFAITGFCTVCSDDNGTSSSLVGVELRSGERRALTDIRDRPESENDAMVDALEVDVCGRVAYRTVRTNAYVRVDPQPELYSWTAAGRQLLDRGRIHRSSIAFSRHFVHWVSAGTVLGRPIAPRCGALPVTHPSTSLGRCGRSHATVARSDLVAVFWVIGRGMLGCVRRTGYTRVVENHPDPSPVETGTVGLVDTAGYRIAWIVSRYCTVCSSDTPSVTIYERNLRRGATRRLEPVRDVPDGSRYGRLIDALTVDPCGRVAYRALLGTSPYLSAGDPPPPLTDPRPELHVWEPGRGRRLVDAGAVHAIRLTPRAVHWTRDGVARSAPLEPAC